MIINRELAKRVIETVDAGLPRSWYTAFRNGQAVHHYPTFEQAMRHWWPDWQPQGNGHEASLDNI